ncbi:MAG: hypothetical protein OSA93_17500 [Akkermansiaceae bacterium]|nr:hypothetical protein [Akkermansiaceae bacterium]
MAAHAVRRAYGHGICDGLTLIAPDADSGQITVRRLHLCIEAIGEKHPRRARIAAGRSAEAPRARN